MLIITRNKYAQYDLGLEENNQDSTVFSYFNGLLTQITNGQVSEFRDEKTAHGVRLESERFIDALLQAVLMAAEDSRCPKEDTNWGELYVNLEKIKADIQSEKQRATLTGKDLAQKMFDEKIELDEAVQRDVFPCVVSIKTPEGFGTGFFEHNGWLVSNAHVLPSVNCVKKAILISDAFEEAPIALGKYGSFHRQINGAPDISIVNIAGSQKCLPFNKFSSDSVYKGSIFFYVYLDHESQERKIGNIELVGQSGAFLTYKCKIGAAPIPGSSGSPVIEAQLKAGRYPEWRFRCVGAVYARSVSSQEGEMLVHVICPAFDFEQIRTEIIIPHDEFERLEKEAASTSDQKLFKERLMRARQQEELQLKSFVRYSTEIIISDLPEDFERLVRTNQELLAMNGQQAQKLNREERERRERLERSEQKKKELALEKLKASANSTMAPFTGKFKKDHVSEPGVESLRSTQDRVSETRSYAAQIGEKTSSVMRMSEENGRQELIKAAESLTTDDLIITEGGKAQIKHGTIHTTEQDYLISSASVKFSSKGRRAVNEDTVRTREKAEVALKVDEDGALKIHHFDGLKK